MSVCSLSPGRMANWPTRGLWRTCKGKGTFVKAHGNELIKERARERIMQVLRQTVTAAKAADIELIDLLGMFEKAYREQA